MVDFLSSPILFPSDMDGSKLSCDPTFKLPEPVDWEEFEFTSLEKTYITNNDIDNDNHHHYLMNNINQYESMNYDHDQQHKLDYSQLFLTLLNNNNNNIEFNQKSMIFTSTFIYNDEVEENLHHQLLLKNNNNISNALRGALDLVENDMQQNEFDKSYHISSSSTYGFNDLYYHNNLSSDNWRDDILDSPPDLVYSLCSSSSHSLVDGNTDDDESLSLNNNDDQFNEPIMMLLSSSSSPLSNTVTPITTTEPFPLSVQVDHRSKNNKKNKSLKSWIKKSMKQATKSMSSQSRKLYHWIKH